MSDVPYLLLPYQARFIEDDSNVKVCEKSRRIGITWAEAANSTLIAAQSGRSGCDTWYLAANEDGAKEFMLDCAFWAKQYKIVASEIETVILQDENKDIQTYQIRFASGWRVTGLTSRPTNLRGKQGRVVADEYAFHPDPEGLEKAGTALLMWGGKTIYISTHNGVNSYFNTLIEQIKAGKKKGKLHRITLDDAIADGLYQRICLVMGKPWTMESEQEWRNELVLSYGENADEELFCIPKAASETYLPGVLVQARMRAVYPVLRLSLPDTFNEKSDYERRSEVEQWCNDRILPILSVLPKDFRSYFGMDFGRTGDLTAIAPLIERSNLKRYTPFMVELRNIPIRQQEQILWFIVDHLPRFCNGCMDARGNGAAIAESTAHRYGSSRIIQMQATQDKYAEIFPRYKTALEDDVLEIPADADVLSDHAAVKLENGIPKVPRGLRYRGTDGNHRHGDGAMGLAFAWWAATESNPAPVIQTSNLLLPPGVTSRNEARDIFAEASKISVRMGRRAVRNIF